jgi:hypothetical protein
LEFARAQEGGEALVFLNADSEADDAVLRDLRALAHVESVQQITM